MKMDNQRFTTQESIEQGRRFEIHGCFEDIFVGSVSVIHQEELLDLGIIHGDGTTTAAKKGGDNLGLRK